MIELSVVVPCWNSRGTLRRALEALSSQNVPEGVFEIVVADDGSTDDSLETLRDWHPPVPFRVLQQPNRGLAAARNLGASQAQGAAVLFVDADVFARPGLVAAHLRHHRAENEAVAVQGQTIPDPETIVTHFMRTSTLMPDLTQRRITNLSPFHVVGRNFSINRRALEQIGGFDETFAGYGLEDVECAFRFHQAGGRIFYAPDALGVHHHPLAIEQAVARQRQNGRAAVRFWRKHGRRGRIGFHFEIHPFLLPLKWLVFRTNVVTDLVNKIRPWAEHHQRYLVLNECYNHLLWRGYYEGVFQALEEELPSPPSMM